MKLISAVVFASTLTIIGCTTVSPEAKSVMVHSQVSNLLDDCIKLGNVNSEVSIIGGGGTMEQEAEYALRQSAYDKYKADTVVILNTDNINFGLAMQGIAYKCDSSQ